MHIKTKDNYDLAFRCGEWRAGQIVPQIDKICTRIETLILIILRLPYFDEWGLLI